MNTFLEIIVILLVIFIPMIAYTLFVSKFERLFENIILEKLPKLAKAIGSLFIFFAIPYTVNIYLPKVIDEGGVIYILIFCGLAFLYYHARNDALVIRYERGIERFFNKNLQELQESNNS